MATLYHRKPCPGGHEIYNLVEASLLIITIYPDCLLDAQDKKEDFQRNNAFSLYDHIWPHPFTVTLAPGVMKFTILVEASLIITLHSLCLLDAQE